MNKSTQELDALSAARADLTIVSNLGDYAQLDIKHKLWHRIARQVGALFFSLFLTTGFANHGYCASGEMLQADSSFVFLPNGVEVFELKQDTNSKICSNKPREFILFDARIRDCGAKVGLAGRQFPSE